MQAALQQGLFALISGRRTDVAPIALAPSQPPLRAAPATNADIVDAVAPRTHLERPWWNRFPPCPVSTMPPAPIPMTTLLLIRHGESEANLREDTHMAGRYVGGIGGDWHRGEGGQPALVLCGIARESFLVTRQRGQCAGMGAVAAGALPVGGGTRRPTSGG